MIDSLRLTWARIDRKENVEDAVNSTAIWKYRKRENVTVQRSVTLT